MEYSTTAVIYREAIGDGSPLNKTFSPIKIAEIDCDIQQETSPYTSASGTVVFLYNVYCDPLDIDIKSGDEITSGDFKGVIMNVWKHDMGCEIKVRDTTGG